MLYELEVSAKDDGQKWNLAPPNMQETTQQEFFAWFMSFMPTAIETRQINIDRVFTTVKMFYTDYALTEGYLVAQDQKSLYAAPGRVWKFSECKHEWVALPGKWNCYHEWQCSKCNKTRAIDSSD